MAASYHTGLLLATAIFIALAKQVCYNAHNPGSFTVLRLHRKTALEPHEESAMAISQPMSARRES